MAEATLKRSDAVEKYTASADLVSGEIVQADSGRAGVVQSLEGVDNGEDTLLSIKGEYELAAANVNGSFNPSIGDAVGWDISADEAVAADNANADFYLGYAVTAAGGAGNAFRVRINETAPQSLTDNTGGTADGTLAAISGSGADSDINNNFADIFKVLKDNGLV